MPRTLIKTKTAGWFIDADGDPDKKVRRKDGDQVLTEAEFKKLKNKAKGKTAQKVTKAQTGKTLVGPTVEITCVDCGKKRTIKVQDKFQVKRCVDCQKDHANKLRREKRAAKAKAKA